MRKEKEIHVLKPERNSSSPSYELATQVYSLRGFWTFQRNKVKAITRTPERVQLSRGFCRF